MNRGLTRQKPACNCSPDFLADSTMPYVNCNLCGADDYGVVFAKGFAQLHRIVRCNRCGLMYSNPQELIDCERFQEPEHPKVFDEVQSRQGFRKQNVQLPDNLRALAVIDSLIPKRGKLLEIGSYCGIFLDRIRSDGWDTTGLEPDLGVADYARGKYGHRIIDGVLPQPSLADGSFDAVVMLHVIEHIPDPSSALREIRRIMKPGGILAVETPRFDSLMFKLLGRRERSISNCNGHIYFFTVPTLSQILKKNDFEIAKVELVGRTLTLDRFLYNVGLITRSQRIKQWLGSLSSALRLDRMSFYLNVHDMQRIYARAK
jgi:2-polyprenyl-3-methyl-5-hydroxy-6-metoxy-1,4-benzoquinol methylase